MVPSGVAEARRAVAAGIERDRTGHEWQPLPPLFVPVPVLPSMGDLAPYRVAVSPPFVVVGGAVFEILEASGGGLEAQWHNPKRAIAMLGDVDFGDALLIRLAVIHIFAVDKHHDVRILLNAVMHDYVVCHEVVQVGHRQVIDWLNPVWMILTISSQYTSLWASWARCGEATTRAIAWARSRLMFC